MRKTIGSIVALYAVAAFAFSPYWGNVPASLGDASMGYCKSGLVTNFFCASVKLPPGEHDAITIVGWYGHSATNSYVFYSMPMLTYTPLAVQLSNPDLLNGAWGDGITGGTNLVSSFSSTNITFATYTNHTIAATAWPHGVWTVAGWTSNACTLNLSGIDYTLGPGSFNMNLIAGGTHDCILTGTGLVSVGIAQTPCHKFFSSMEYQTGSGVLPLTMISSTNGIYLYSIRIQLSGTNHISSFDSRAMNKAWTSGLSSTNDCPYRFSSRGIYQMMMNTLNNTEIKNETIFDYRVFPFRLTDEQLERIYQNGRDEVIRRGL